MCFFHKWDKWEQYEQDSVCYGTIFKKSDPYEIVRRRQRRKCEKCGKEQDEPVFGS
jgi:hypothetical protein